MRQSDRRWVEHGCNSPSEEYTASGSRHWRGRGQCYAAATDRQFHQEKKQQDWIDYESIERAKVRSESTIMKRHEARYICNSSHSLKDLFLLTAESIQSCHSLLSHSLFYSELSSASSSQSAYALQAKWPVDCDLSKHPHPHGWDERVQTEALD